MRVLNEKAGRIAQLNTQIGSIESNGSMANDLRDQRDMLAKEISGLANVRTLERSTGSLEYSREVATTYQAQALSALDVLPASPHRDSMRAIAELAIQRNH